MTLMETCGLSDKRRLRAWVLQQTLCWPIVAAWLVLGADAVWSSQIECPKILSAISRPEDGVPGHAPDLSRVAKRLGTNVAWIEQCMRAYGRRSRRPGLESAEGREMKLEALEVYEREEPREPEERGVVELRRIPDRQPKLPKKKKKPSSSGFGDEEEQ